MTDFTDFTLPVMFWPKPDVLDELRAVANRLDEQTGLGMVEDDAEPMTFAQAITVVLHNAPERLHEFLAGWSVETSWDDLGKVK